jgi:hypothetical protein
MTTPNSKSIRYLVVLCWLQLFVSTHLSAQKPPPGVGSGGNIPLERRNTLQNKSQNK